MIKHQRRKKQVETLSKEFGWDAQAAVPMLKVNPYRDLGASGHNVMAGILLDSGTSVVVKPHIKRSKAEREASIGNHLRRLGLNVPQYLGVYTGKLREYLIIEDVIGLNTLADVALNTSIAHPSVTKVIIPRLERSGRAAADLHSKDSVHLDLQGRNLAEDPDQKPVYIDLECAQIRSSAVNSVSRAQDLYKLCGSVLRYGFLAEKSSRFRADAIQDAVISPYREQGPNLQTDYDLIDLAVNVAAARPIPIGKITDAAGMTLPRGTGHSRG